MNNLLRDSVLKVESIEKEKEQFCCGEADSDVFMVPITHDKLDFRHTSDCVNMNVISSP